MMKKKVLCLLLAALLLCAMLPRQAHAASASDLTFTLNDDGESYSVSECETSAQGALEIPATYQGKPVTGIDSEAFFGCSGLTNITIPDSITSIGSMAFYECSSLTNITIPNSVADIGGGAFAYCSSLTDLPIPDSVTSINEDMFLSCSSLTSITIPEGVTSIGGWAFHDCTSLTSVTIPVSVTSIGDSAFWNCHRLTGIWVDENNPNYSSDSFGVLFDKGKTKLIQAPGALLDTYAVPDSVHIIDDFAFESCSNLTNITLPDSITAIGNSAFEACSSLTSITIPEGVTSIGGGAFSDCSSLIGITIPDSVTSIGDYAFEYCSSLTYITLPEGVTSIGYCAFNECTSLSSITIPESVTSIGYGAFWACNLTGIWVDENNSNYSSDGFGVLFDKSKTELIQAPRGLSGKYAIPGSVTTIDDHAFWGCENLTGIIIPDGVTGTGWGAFMECRNLTSITISDSVISIDDFAFDHCSSLVGITIPDNVTSIGDSAFFHCYSLHSITIPENVTEIGEWAFCECSSLTDVYYGGTEEQWAQVSVDTGNELLTNATIHFNAHSVSDVELTSWQYVHVQYALDRNLMAGKGTDTHGRIKFDPNSPITREEFVQVQYNAEGKPAVDLLNPFPDVAENGWYKNAVLWAKENDIANGGGDGNFGIGARIIRQDLALMLYKYARLKNCSLEAQEGITDQFGDKDSISGYAKTAMDWAVTNGILSGKGTAGQPLSTFRLDPTGTATRAECAAMLRNFMTAFGL